MFLPAEMIGKMDGKCLKLLPTIIIIEKKRGSTITAAETHFQILKVEEAI